MKRLRVLRALAFCLLSFAAAGEASDVVYFGWGDESIKVQQFSPGDSRGESITFDFECFKILNLPVWTREGDYVVHTVSRPYTPDEAAVARMLGVSEANLGTPLLYKVPLGWVVFGGLYILYKINRLIKVRETRRQLATVLGDQRNRQAMAIYLRDPRGTLDAAVNHLVTQGVPYESALQTMQMLQNTMEQWMVMEILREFPAPSGEPERQYKRPSVVKRVTQMFLKRR